MFAPPQGGNPWVRLGNDGGAAPARAGEAAGAAVEHAIRVNNRFEAGHGNWYDMREDALSASQAAGLVHNDDGSAPLYLVLEAHRVADRRDRLAEDDEPRLPRARDIFRAVVGVLGHAVAHHHIENRGRRRRDNLRGEDRFGQGGFGQHHFPIHGHGELPAAAIAAAAGQAEPEPNRRIDNIAENIVDRPRVDQYHHAEYGNAFGRGRYRNRHETHHTWTNETRVQST